MKEYKVIISKWAHKSLSDIIKHKLKYCEDLKSIKHFYDWFYADAEKLSYLPYRGTNFKGGYKAYPYAWHWIVYKVIEPDKVYIMDVFDPRQYSFANHYY